MSYTVECPCGKSVSTTKTGNVGAIIDDTGYKWIMLHSGGSLWLCPECAAEVEALADQICAKVKNGMVYFPHCCSEALRQKLREEHA